MLLGSGSSKSSEALQDFEEIKDYSKSQTLGDHSRTIHEEQKILPGPRIRHERIKLYASLKTSLEVVLNISLALELLY